MAVTVRLFAGDTVVEQHFTLQREDNGDLNLEYDFGADVPNGLVTSENGKPVPIEYQFLDGEVTYSATYPLEPSDDGYRDTNRLAIAGQLPGDHFARRVLLMLANPLPVGPDCSLSAAAPDAEALARSIRSNPNFEATAPEPVTVAGTSGLQMDVKLKPGANLCSYSEPELSGQSAMLFNDAAFIVYNRAHVILLDLPAGSEAQVLALVTISDEDSMDAVLSYAAPVVDSIEIHAS
jgi:hypothetical protein